ncbi:class I SAM-dependent methyltransferase [Phenylobacterium sp.]|uniref:SAM-dependent methyltransferase n=1 Tax=Phenylobacterium sp. TaxID=1871053 RepID=UPI002811B156|nr:class I SAM-dependent methyltransferase [Phenylobacterium sp.]
MKAYLFAAALALIACQAPPAVQEADAQPAPASKPPERGPDVIYVPTPPETVDAMLKLGEVKPGDVLYDLGSGDGRIPIAAAKQFGIRAVGIDIDPKRIEEANANAKAAGVTHLVTFRNEDLFEADFREATVVTLYLLPSLNEKLMPKLLSDLKPGTRIVSHAFPMGQWEPEQTVNVPAGGVIYRWTVPEKKAR